MSERGRASERAAAVSAAMGDIAGIDAASRERGGIDRVDLERIKERLLVLAKREDLFGDDDFPPPESPGTSVSYRISQTDADELALYLQCVSDGTSAPPHEHSTWAVIVGMRGQELNRLYGLCAGAGEPQVRQEVVVEQGAGVAMLGDDVHSIQIEGAATNFHCYGLALERLAGRRFWHAPSREWRPYNDIGHIVEARPSKT